METPKKLRELLTCRSLQATWKGICQLALATLQLEEELRTHIAERLSTLHHYISLCGEGHVTQPVSSTTTESIISKTSNVSTSAKPMVVAACATDYGAQLGIGAK